MPQYVFEQLDNPNVRSERFYHMKEAPKVGTVITDDKGIKWKRVFTKPQASIDTKMDPYSARDFVKATSKPGQIGDLWDRSREASMKRADKEGGVDPVREAYFKNYSKRRHGKKHPEQQREDSVKELKKAGIKVDWGNDD